jgi:thiol-disulfide isomerase/thioredoxin
MLAHFMRNRIVRMVPLVWFAVAPLLAQSSRTTVVDLDGKAVDPFHEAGSKAIVFLFVRSDCPISNRYAPTIQELSRRYSGSAKFFLVYPIASENAQQIRKHLQEYDYHLPVLRDPELALARRSQVRITPEAAVFSGAGKLIYHGRIDDWYVEFGRSRREPTTHELASAIESVVAGKALASASEPAVGCFIPGLT